MLKNPTAVFETSVGTFHADIYLDRVPITASNFIALCREGFYDGLHFHRVVEGFVNQFGCPYSKNAMSPMAGKGGPLDTPFINLANGSKVHRSGCAIQDENISLDSNIEGTLSMANSGAPNTNGSQFFTNCANNTSLDWFTPGAKHPVFGKITQGMDVVHKINKIPVGVGSSKERPVMAIKMEKITINGAPVVEAAVDSSSSSSSSSSKKKRRKTKKDKKKKTKKKKSSSSSSSSSSERQEKVSAIHILRKHRNSTRPSSHREPTIRCTKEEAAAFLKDLRNDLSTLARPGFDWKRLAKRFQELARKHSDCSSYKKGGDLGSFTKDKMQKPFSDAAFGLEVGEMSDVVNTDSGVHLILRTK